MRDQGPLRVRDVHKSFDTTVVLAGAELDVEPGAVVALLGPSGSGKTTLLRCIAGLEQPDRGVITLGDRVLRGSDSSGRVVDVAPERRGVGMVFQDWALFPHLDVRDNVGYGLPRADRRGPRVDEVLELVGLSGYERRMPGTLSGGQRQRVALARALAPRPGVLLLDEPFSNLDSSLRTRIRGEVHRLLLDVGITTVFVTHDQEEAFVLGDTVALVHEGRIVQQDPPRDIYRRPVSPWAAAFVGDANLLEGTAAGREAVTALGPIELAGQYEGTAQHKGAVTVLVRPEDVVVEAVVDASDTTATRGHVTRVEYLGHDSMLTVACGELSLLVRTRSDQWRPDDTVTIRFAGYPAAAWPASSSSSR